MVRQIQLEWNNFFDETNNSYYNGVILNGNSYYIIDIISANSSERFLSYGSEVTSTKILIESSLFYNNSYNGDGCNIFIDSNGDIVQKRVCAYKCSASRRGQHCYIRNAFSQKNKNYNIESSFTNLVTSNGESPVSHSYGEVIIEKVNISYCFTYSVSGFWLADSDFNGNLTYSLFSSNNSSHIYCLKLAHSTNNPIINCNIIGNTASDQLIIIYRGDFKFINCNIIKNNANNIFWTSRGGDYKVISCIYDFNITDDHIRYYRDIESYSYESELTFYETAECGPISILTDTNSSFLDFLKSLIKNPSSKVPSLFNK